MLSRLVAVALALLPATATAGPCAIQPPHPQVLTKAGTSIAAQGGIVVGMIEGFVETDAGDPAAWQFRAGKQLAKPVLATLAPGLLVLALPAAGDPVVLESAAHVEQVAVKRGEKANLLAAPRVRKVVESTIPGGPRSSAINQVVVELIAAPPTEAMALVAFGIDGQATTPRSWVAVDHDKLAWVVYHSPGRCETLAPGTLRSGPGDHVAFAWVDRSGRLSTMSAEAIVASEPASP